MKKLIYLFILVLLIITSGCHQDKKHSYKKPKHIKSKDTLFVTRRSAISIWLDSATLEKRKKQYGDEDSEAASEDFSFYSAAADSILKSHRLQVIEAQGYKYLQFIQNDRVKTLIKIDTLEQIYTLYFFDPAKQPYEADAADIEDAYNQYFH